MLERHFKIGDSPLTFETLIEMSRTSPRRMVDMMRDELTFTEQGELNANLSKAAIETGRGMRRHSICLQTRTRICSCGGAR